MISLCGSFNAPMLAIILPPLFAVWHLPSSRSPGYLALHALIFLIGIVSSSKLVRVYLPQTEAWRHGHRLAWASGQLYLSSGS